METEKLFTAQEVAKELNVSDAYIRQMIADGVARPKQKLGRIWVFDSNEVDRLRNRIKYPGGRGKKRPTE
jgi:excisionase family DNA binding protein